MVYTVIAILVMGGYFIVPVSTAHYKPLLSFVSGLLWPVIVLWMVLAGIVYLVTPAKV